MSVGIVVGVAGRGVKVSVMEIAVTVGGSGVDEAMSGACGDGDARHAETVSMHKTNKKILIGVINLIEPSLLRLGLSS